MRTAIWLDDLRDPEDEQWAALIKRSGVAPDTVIWVKSYADFVATVPKVAATGELAAVFFDNDLGSGREGRHAFTWLDEYVRTHHLTPFRLFAQTANPAARRELHAGFESLRRHWEGV